MTRSCRATKIKHTVPYDSSIGCKECHSSKCFVHLLELGVHCAEVFSVNKNDPESWHKYHQAAKNLFKDSQDDIGQAEKRGVAPILKYKLTTMAQGYGVCKPISPYTSLGWYDNQHIMKPVSILSVTNRSLQSYMYLRGSQTPGSAVERRNR